MKSRFMKAIGMLVLGALTVSARADEEKVALDKVPAKVMKTVMAKFPGAKAMSATKDVEDGKTIYEVLVKHEGSEIDVSVSDAGKLVSYEKEVETEDLPKAVVAAAMKKYPKAKIEEAAELHEGDSMNYELTIEIKGKKSFALVISPKGKIVEDENPELEKKDK